MDRVLIKRSYPVVVRVGSGSIAALAKVAEAGNAVDSNPGQTATICIRESGRPDGRDIMVEKKDIYWSDKQRNKYL
ncbi:MAG: hypothetical protein KOO62_13660 [candidate division Zixibacteria bacterium]|nr:hypothetical protein [candidate division Zixibacteria bacterium]